MPEAVIPLASKGALVTKRNEVGPETTILPESFDIPSTEAKESCPVCVAVRSRFPASCTSEELAVSWIPVVALFPSTTISRSVSALVLTVPSAQLIPTLLESVFFDSINTDLLAKSIIPPYLTKAPLALFPVEAFARNVVLSPPKTRFPPAAAATNEAYPLEPFITASASPVISPERVSVPLLSLKKAHTPNSFPPPTIEKVPVPTKEPELPEPATWKADAY